jgi:hypothetical protein
LYRSLIRLAKEAFRYRARSMLSDATGPKNLGSGGNPAIEGQIVSAHVGFV